MVIKTDVQGYCYYKWYAEDEETPVVDTSCPVVSDDNGEFTIHLEGLNAEKSNQLLFRIMDNNNRLSEPHGAGLGQPAEPSVTETPEPTVMATPTPEITAGPSPTPSLTPKPLPLPTTTPEPTPTAIPDPTQAPEPTEEPEITAKPKPTEKLTPKPSPSVTLPAISLKWTGFNWLSHTSASVTLQANVDGKCYYKWVERQDDGTSKTPDLNSKSSYVTIKTDKSFTINLNDLKTDKAIDLYILVIGENGGKSGIKRLKLDQERRPAVKPAHNAVIPSVTQSILRGFDSPLKFYPNAFYDFSVIGAGTTNKNPGEGDVKWVPLYWSTSSNPNDAQKNSTWEIGSTKGISKAATYNMYVFFKKWVYTGGQWTETDTIDSAVYQFSSAKISFTTTIKLPIPALSGTSNSSSGVVLKWKKVSNASGYKIYRKTGNSSKWNNIATVKGSGTLTYIDGSAKAGSTYTYTVRAYKGSGLGDYNKTGSKIVRLTAPGQYAPASKAAGKLKVSWKRSASASGYQIQYSTSKNFSGAKTVSTASLTKTLSGLKKGKTYYTRVRAYKKVSGKTYYSAWGAGKSVKIRK